MVMWALDRFKRYGRWSGRGKPFLGQSIGIDETNTFQLKFISSMKIVGATGLGDLWSLEWAWHSAETNLRCVRSSGICMPNTNSVNPDRWTDKQTDTQWSKRLIYQRLVNTS